MAEDPRGNDLIRCTYPFQNADAIELCQFRDGAGNPLPIGIELVDGKFYCNHFDGTASVNRPPDHEDGTRQFTDMPDAPGWLRFVCRDSSNVNIRKLFYYHKSSNTYQWQNPILLKNLLIKFSIRSIRRGFYLPENWECKLYPIHVNYGGEDQRLQQYAPIFINHYTKQVQWEDPRVTMCKLEMLQTFCAMNRQKVLSRLALRRDSLFLDIEAQLAWWEVRQLHPERLEISFGENPLPDNNSALDYIVNELTHNTLCLFAHDVTDGSVIIHPLTGSNYYNLRHYYIFGRLLGLILFQDCRITAKFSNQIMSPLCGKESVDENVMLNSSLFNELKSLYDMANNSLTQQNANYTNFFRQAARSNLNFSIDTRKPGEAKYYKIDIKQNEIILDANQILPLAPGAKDYSYQIKYTLNSLIGQGSCDRTKCERLLDEIRTIVTKSCFWSQMQAIKNGIKDVIPLEWLQMFDENELRFLFNRN